MHLFSQSRFLFLSAGLFVGLCGCNDSSAGKSGTQKAENTAAQKNISILNVSYDPTRELYQEFNTAFAQNWEKETGQKVEVEQSHGGSGSQSRKVNDGLEADVVTLALAYDIDAIAKKGSVATNWQKNLSNNSAPYTSTIVFLVRKGNPKQVKDWSDLVKGDTQVITASPKTGGGARWNYLAAWGAILKKELGDLKKLSDPSAKDEVAKANQKARDYVTELYKHVTVLDASARASTNTFTRGTGDVMIGWENEAFFILNSADKDKYELVVPSVSILAEPPVTVVDKNVDKHGTRKVAEAYLQYLYSPKGQQIIAKNFYRPVKFDSIPEDQKKQFAQIELFGIDEVFGGWNKAQAEHFNDGGVFDEILKAGRK